MSATDPARNEPTQVVDPHPRRRGGVLYLGATVSAQAFALLRYVVLARLLGPQQLGLAAAVTVAAGLFDLISDTGSDRFLIQDREGDAPALQQLVQLVILVRGGLVGASLVVFALPIAHFYGTPALAMGLATLALSPLLLGALNLDIRRAQRHHDFRPEAVCMIAAETAGLAGAVLAAWLRPDFMAVVFGLIVRAAVLVACSHVVGTRPYRLGWNAGLAARLRRFAAPLMLNGLMLFIVSQGDRVIVGRALGLTSLGTYSAIILLIYYPSSVIGNYLHALFIPMIAARRDHPTERNRVSDQLGGQSLLLGLAMAVGFAIVAPPLVPVLFGARFAQDSLLIALIGVLQTVRFMLNWPSTAVLAIGRSDTLLYSNLAHVAIFPTAFAGLWLIGGMIGVVAGFLAGEVFAAVVALLLLNRATGRAGTEGFGRLAALLAGGGAIVGWNVLARYAPAGPPLPWLWWPAAAALVATTVALLVWIARMEAAVIDAALMQVRATIAALRSRRVPV